MILEIFAQELRAFPVGLLRFDAHRADELHPRRDGVKRRRAEIDERGDDDHERQVTRRKRNCVRRRAFAERIDRHAERKPERAVSGDGNHPQQQARDCAAGAEFRAAQDESDE